MSSPLKTRYVYEGVVDSVYDADSWTVSLDLGCHVTLHGEKVRLHGINAAEIRGPEKEKGLAAKKHAEAMLQKYSIGKDGELRFAFRTRPGNGREKEKFGRWLVEVIGRCPYTGSPVSLNSRLVDHPHISAVDYG